MEDLRNLHKNWSSILSRTSTGKTHSELGISLADLSRLYGIRMNTVRWFPTQAARTHWIRLFDATPKKGGNNKIRIKLPSIAGEKRPREEEEEEEKEPVILSNPPKKKPMISTTITLPNGSTVPSYLPTLQVCTKLERRIYDMFANAGNGASHHGTILRSRIAFAVARDVQRDGWWQWAKSSHSPHDLNKLNTETMRTGLDGFTKLAWKESSLRLMLKAVQTILDEADDSSSSPPLVPVTAAAN